MAVASTTSPIHSGWLRRKGEGLLLFQHRWTRYWVVLRGESLEFYDSREERKTSFSIPLRQTTLFLTSHPKYEGYFEVLPQHPFHPFQTAATTSGSKHATPLAKLVAPSPCAYIEWITKFERVIEKGTIPGLRIEHDSSLSTDTSTTTLNPQPQRATTTTTTSSSRDSNNSNNSRDRNNNGSQTAALSPLSSSSKRSLDDTFVDHNADDSGRIPKHLASPSGLLSPQFPSSSSQTRRGGGRGGEGVLASASSANNSNKSVGSVPSKVTDNGAGVGILYDHYRNKEKENNKDKRGANDKREDGDNDNDYENEDDEEAVQITAEEVAALKRGGLKKKRDMFVTPHHSAKLVNGFGEDTDIIEGGETRDIIEDKHTDDDNDDEKKMSSSSSLLLPTTERTTSQAESSSSSSSSEESLLDQNNHLSNKPQNHQQNSNCLPIAIVLHKFSSVQLLGEEIVPEHMKDLRHITTTVGPSPQSSPSKKREDRSIKNDHDTAVADSNQTASLFISPVSRKNSSTTTHNHHQHALVEQVEGEEEDGGRFSSEIGSSALASSLVNEDNKNSITHGVNHSSSSNTNYHHHHHNNNNIIPSSKEIDSSILDVTLASPALSLKQLLPVAVPTMQALTSPAQSSSSSSSLFEISPIKETEGADEYDEHDKEEDDDAEINAAEYKNLGGLHSPTPVAVSSPTVTLLNNENGGTGDNDDEQDEEEIPNDYPSGADVKAIAYASRRHHHAENTPSHSSVTSRNNDNKPNDAADGDENDAHLASMTTPRAVSGADAREEEKEQLVGTGATPTSTNENLMTPLAASSLAAISGGISSSLQLLEGGFISPVAHEDEELEEDKVEEEVATAGKEGVDKKAEEKDADNNNKSLTTSPSSPTFSLSPPLVPTSGNIGARLMEEEEKEGNNERVIHEDNDNFDEIKGVTTPVAEESIINAAKVSEIGNANRHADTLLVPPMMSLSPAQQQQEEEARTETETKKETKTVIAANVRATNEPEILIESANMLPPRTPQMAPPQSPSATSPTLSTSENNTLCPSTTPSSPSTLPATALLFPMGLPLPPPPPPPTSAKRKNKRSKNNSTSDTNSASFFSLPNNNTSAGTESADTSLVMVNDINISTVDDNKQIPVVAVSTVETATLNAADVNVKVQEDTKDTNTPIALIPVSSATPAGTSMIEETVAGTASFSPLRELPVPSTAETAETISPLANVETSPPVMPSPKTDKTESSLNLPSETLLLPDTTVSPSTITNLLRSSSQTLAQEHKEPDHVESNDIITHSGTTTVLTPPTSPASTQRRALKNRTAERLRARQTAAAVVPAGEVKRHDEETLKDDGHRNDDDGMRSGSSHNNNVPLVNPFNPPSPIQHVADIFGSMNAYPSSSSESSPASSSSSSSSSFAYPNPFSSPESISLPPNPTVATTENKELDQDGLTTTEKETQPVIATLFSSEHAKPNEEWNVFVNTAVNDEAGVPKQDTDQHEEQEEDSQAEFLRLQGLITETKHKATSLLEKLKEKENSLVMAEAEEEERENNALEVIEIVLLENDMDSTHLGDNDDDVVKEEQIAAQETKNKTVVMTSISPQPMQSPSSSSSSSRRIRRGMGTPDGKIRQIQMMPQEAGEDDAMMSPTTATRIITQEEKPAAIVLSPSVHEAANAAIADLFHSPQVSSASASLSRVTYSSREEDQHTLALSLLEQQQQPQQPLPPSTPIISVDELLDWGILTPRQSQLDAASPVLVSTTKDEETITPASTKKDLPTTTSLFTDGVSPVVTSSGSLLLPSSLSEKRAVTDTISTLSTSASIRPLAEPTVALASPTSKTNSKQITSKSSNSKEPEQQQQQQPKIEVKKSGENVSLSPSKTTAPVTSAATNSIVPSVSVPSSIATASSSPISKKNNVNIAAHQTASVAAKSNPALQPLSTMHLNINISNKPNMSKASLPLKTEAAIQAEHETFTKNMEAWLKQFEARQALLLSSSTAAVSSSSSSSLLIPDTANGKEEDVDDMGPGQLLSSNTGSTFITAMSTISSGKSSNSSNSGHNTMNGGGLKGQLSGTYSTTTSSLSSSLSPFSSFDFSKLAPSSSSSLGPGIVSTSSTSSTTHQAIGERSSRRRSSSVSSTRSGESTDPHRSTTRSRGPMQVGMLTSLSSSSSKFSQDDAGIANRRRSRSNSSNGSVNYYPPSITTAPDHHENSGSKRFISAGGGLGGKTPKFYQSAGPAPEMQRMQEKGAVGGGENDIPGKRGGSGLVRRGRGKKANTTSTNVRSSSAPKSLSSSSSSSSSSSLQRNHHHIGAPSTITPLLTADNPVTGLLHYHAEQLHRMLCRSKLAGWSNNNNSSNSSGGSSVARRSIVGTGGLERDMPSFSTSSSSVQAPPAYIGPTPAALVAALGDILSQSNSSRGRSSSSTRRSSSSVSQQQQQQQQQRAPDGVDRTRVRTFSAVKKGVVVRGAGSRAPSLVGAASWK